MLRDANHVRVADAPPFDGGDDGHAGGKLAFLRLHAEDPCIGTLDGVEYFRRRRQHRARGHRLDEQAVGICTPVLERLLQTRSDGAARLVCNQRHALARLNRETGIDGIVRAGHQIGRRRAVKRHR